MIMEKKYDTFWPRWAAGFLDGLIFMPLGFISLFLRNNPHVPVIIACILTAIYNFSRPVYTIWMHGRYGQTVGKKALNIILLNVEETRVINYKEALLRESPYLIMLFLYSILSIYILFSNGNFSPSLVVSVSILSFTNLIWFLLEVITMLTNNKRRALHDLIAGSVVIRKEFMFMEKFPEHPEQFTSEEAA
jgi:uncharacterized RDD family membrane protein YckC